MKSKTHVYAGMAAALAVNLVSEPLSIENTLAAIVGGVAGAILCDIEVRIKRGGREVLYGRIIALAICAAALIIDITLKAGLCERALMRPKKYTVSGALTLLAVCGIGRFTPHRTFTHSLVYVGLLGLGFYLVCPTLLAPTLLGGLSHLMLDTLNKKPVPWFYPLFRPGLCLKLFYSDKIADNAFMWAFLAADLCLIGYAAYYLA